MREACDADQALILTSELRPDLILVDLRMPGRDGLDLIPDLRAREPEAIIIVPTGCGSIATTLAATRRGADHYISKPADVDQILRRPGCRAFTAGLCKGSCLSIRQASRSGGQCPQVSQVLRYKDPARPLRLLRESNPHKIPVVPVDAVTDRSREPLAPQSKGDGGAVRNFFLYLHARTEGRNIFQNGLHRLECPAGQPFHCNQICA